MYISQEQYDIIRDCCWMIDKRLTSKEGCENIFRRLRQNLVKLANDIASNEDNLSRADITSSGRDIDAYIDSIMKGHNDLCDRVCRIEQWLRAQCGGCKKRKR